MIEVVATCTCMFPLSKNPRPALLWFVPCFTPCLICSAIVLDQEELDICLYDRSTKLLMCALDAPMT